MKSPHYTPSLQHIYYTVFLNSKSRNCHLNFTEEKKMSFQRIWPIMQQLERDFLDNVQSFMVIGKQSDGVMMLTKDGKVYWFGSMQFGGESRQAEEPTQLMVSENVTSLAQGNEHILLLTSMGQCLALGKIKLTTAFYPVIISNGFKFSSIKSGPEHCVALGEDQNVYCWDRYKSMNLPQPQFCFEPVLKLSTDRIVAIACGEYHALALSEQGKVFGWYSDNFYLNRIGPTQISVNNCVIKSIACGQYRCLLLTTNGEVYCCGENSFESLNEKDWVATLVSGLPTITQISTHYATNLWAAMSNDKTVYVLGQFEDGTDILTSIKFNSESILAPLAMNSSKSNYPYLMPMQELSQFVTKDQSATTPNRLPLRISAMFDNPAKSDVQFVVDQKTIHAHQCFLRVSSDYFSKLLSETWLPTKPNEPLNPILIDDYCYSVFYAYLRFLYTGTFQVSEDNLIEFFDLASCYLEGELCQMSLDQMQASISVQNCSLYYELTDLHQVPEFEQFVVKFIFNHVFQVFGTESYRAMKPELCKKLTIAIGQLKPQN